MGKEPRNAFDRVASDGRAQLIAELWERLRTSNFAWWSADVVRGHFPIADRFAWLADSPELRAAIAHKVTGLAAAAAEKLPAATQVQLIEAALASKATTGAAVEEAFPGVEIAAWAPPGSVWAAFRKSAPSTSGDEAMRSFAGWLLDRLLAARGLDKDMVRTPILTASELRTALPHRALQTHMPVDLRVAIDEARFAALAKGSYDPGVEVQAVGVAALARHLPWESLGPVLDAAGKAMAGPVLARPAKPEPERTAPVGRQEPVRAEVGPRPGPARAPKENVTFEFPGAGGPDSEETVTAAQRRGLR